MLFIGGKTLTHQALFCKCLFPLLAGSLVEDIGEMILQIRRQVESLFSIKYGKLPAVTELNPSFIPGQEVISGSLILQ